MATRDASMDALMERLTQMDQSLTRMEVARNEAGDDDPTVLVRLDALEKLGSLLMVRTEALTGDVSTLENQFRRLNTDMQAIGVKCMEVVQDFNVEVGVLKRVMCSGEHGTGMAGLARLGTGKSWHMHNLACDGHGKAWHGIEHGHGMTRAWQRLARLGTGKPWHRQGIEHELGMEDMAKIPAVGTGSNVGALDFIFLTHRTTWIHGPTTYSVSDGACRVVAGVLALSGVGEEEVLATEVTIVKVGAFSDFLWE
ncbi:hypothetical protein Scep_030195 [Stephania cephalantha]|uniref:Uncharacterized protein n=1 Tax=Stephania cephalantha TaxID=152367 RepID=A0AAP0E6T9_9MAGN